MNESIALPAIEWDTAAGRRLGVRGTPTFLINELMIAGYPGAERLEQYVNAAVRRARARR